ALLATKGYAAPETGRTYRRAHELCRLVGMSADISRVLVGVYLFELTQANHAVARTVAVETLERAEREEDVDAQAVGHVLIRLVEFHTGALATAWRRCQRAISIYETRDAAELAFRYGIDAGAAAYAYGSWCLWLLGHAEEARKLGDEAQAVIERSSW